MTGTCNSCSKQGLKCLSTHPHRNPSCRRTYLPDKISTHAIVASYSLLLLPIPLIINTGTPPTPSPAADRSNSYSSRLRTRETPMNYAESARKLVRTFDKDISYPSPGDDLGDYVSTCVNSNGISCRLGLVCTLLCICSSSTYRIISGLAY
jgi:hypothetical protein